MFSPLPATLEQYHELTEQSLLDALPVNFIKEWLLMTQLPYLLSFRVAGNETIKAYAEWAAWRMPFKGEGSGLSRAGVAMRESLKELEKTLEKYSKDLDDQTKPYDVLYPDYIAQSILI
jgi:hypothetical protein